MGKTDAQFLIDFNGKPYTVHFMSSGFLCVLYES